MDAKAQIFIDEMQARYPDHLEGYAIETIDHLYEQVYNADCFWDDEMEDLLNRSAREAVVDSDELHRYRRAAPTTYGNFSGTTVVVEEPHSILETLAHAFHKASIAILGVLFVEV